MSRSSRGFTLVEVLLATALLAAAMTLAFATVRAAAAVVQRGEARAARDGRIRAVEGFLRARLSAAQGIAWGIDTRTGVTQRFEGDERRLAFVGDLPAWLGRGGPHRHVLQVQGRPGALQLEVDFAIVQAGTTVGAGAIPPEPLASGLTDVRFAYRGVTQEGKAGPWQPRWTQAETLPVQVRIDIADAQGAWPSMVIPLPLAASYAGMASLP